ncbi:MAG: putative toxin-antitoxin system toxin component, PIN family [Verrucomicrobiota bacterium]|nr:putative toxin-antitoxin system toxin component, PIN family [Verrucomicrobiota bacterium]
MKPVPSWVLDTNVVVAGLLNAHGFPGRLLDAVLAGTLRITFDDRIEREYREVLARPKFAIPSTLREAILGELRSQDAIAVASGAVKALPDPDDLPFLESALQATDHILVTGNLKHYPPAARGNVVVLSPAEAWKRLTAG